MSDMTLAKKLYWHELPDEMVDAMIKAGVTWGHIRENYREPEWCSHPEPLYGNMGCWTLTDITLRGVISREYCSTCDLCRKDDNSK